MPKKGIFVPNLSVKTNNFDFFWTNFAQKEYFRLKTIKSGCHHWILHIRISVITKFHLKQTILNIGIKFSQKGYFWLKTEEGDITIEMMNMAIEICIYELV